VKQSEPVALEKPVNPSRQGSLLTQNRYDEQVRGREENAPEKPCSLGKDTEYEPHPNKF
jgi:hypothetical protein